MRTPVHSSFSELIKLLPVFGRLRSGIPSPMSTDLNYTVNPVHASGTDSEFDVMDTAFIEQIASTREALKIFKVIITLDEPHSSKAVLEELVNISVRDY